MKLHRFYVPSIELKHDLWLHDEKLVHQWRHVLRFQPGQEVVLFDGLRQNKLYKLVDLTDREAHVEHITDMVPKTPSKEIYLLWALLKKDKNDWVLQKCTELGVSHFIPLITERTEKMGFDEERARKIVIEAAEQCGRSDIPTVREPVHISAVIDELSEKVDLYICEQDGENEQQVTDKPQGIFIGPEGGWSDTEKQLFHDKSLKHLNLHDFTLRAETAAIAASTKLLS
jgi:16S rRNA (uracil1498-N3)-methyltransferase